MSSKSKAVSGIWENDDRLPVVKREGETRVAGFVRRGPDEWIA